MGFFTVLAGRPGEQDSAERGTVEDFVSAAQTADGEVGVGEGEGTMWGDAPGGEESLVGLRWNRCVILGVSHEGKVPSG